MHGNEDITDLPTEFRSSADPRDLQIVLTSRPAVLMVRVFGEDGLPASNCRVAILPVDPRRWKTPALIDAWSSLAKEGIFRTMQGRAGDYLLVAISLEDALAISDEADLARLARMAERVTLLENDRRAIDIRLAKRPTR